MTDWKLAQGWGPDFDKAMKEYTAKGLLPARVITVYRKQLRVLSHRGEHWCRTAGRMLHKAESIEQLPAVGDWIAARIPETGDGLAQAVLPRRTSFVRKTVGENAEPQVLAANIDTVVVMMGLGRDFNLRRLERFMTLAWESKATPVVVLNKKDLAEDFDELLAEVNGITRGAAVYAVSALTGDGVGPIHDLLGVGQTVVFLGSSGVGKSTLVNQMAGSQVMTTGAVRSDGRGRHTTTRRELIFLPQGGSIIDTPGIRELQMWAAEEGLAKTFDDIKAIAQGCKFSDCRHNQEPGCAVKVALEDGTLDDFRFESWLELQAEIERIRMPIDLRGRTVSKRRERVGSGAKK